jgi:hypothetical protein
MTPWAQSSDPRDIPGYNDISELDPEVHTKRQALLEREMERIIMMSDEDSEIEYTPHDL